jgi:putative copper export protein
MEFTWSLIFFLHVFLWVIIVFLIYFPAKDIFQNSIFGLITGIIFASITGSFGIITKFTNLIETMFGKLLYLTLFIIVLIFLLILYRSFFKLSHKESEEEELERAKENIKAYGKLSEES